MKKHLFLSILLTLAAGIAIQAQSSTAYSIKPTADALQNIRSVAEEQFGIFSTQDNNRQHNQNDCDKCRQQNRSKKHDECSQPGNHYGKHKKQHNKHACCECNRRGQKPDCNHDDRRYGSNNSRNGRDDDRYGSTTRRERNTTPQSSQNKPTSTAKVKTRPTPTTQPTSRTQTASKAKKKVVTRPAGTK